MLGLLFVLPLKVIMIKTINHGLLLLVFLFVISCQKNDTENAVLDYSVKDCEESGINKRFVFVEDGKRLLSGGENDSWSFDITGWSLKECQLNYGLGREYFKALIQPEYIKASELSNSYSTNERTILLLSGGLPKVYPLRLLREHEVINEIVDGKPVMIAYCILADLAAVYSRTYCDTTFTFALSGYTYWDTEVWDGINAFVLWDRETESLWWPLIDQAVSGTMQGTNLRKHDEDKWREATWGEVLDNYPDALVFKAGQTMEAPTNWRRYEEPPCK